MSTWQIQILTPNGTDPEKCDRWAEKHKEGGNHDDTDHTVCKKKKN